MRRDEGARVLRLSSKWAEFFKSHAETEMGYVITIIILKDGRRFERATVIGGVVSSIDGRQDIPFIEGDIAEFVVTHDKRSRSSQIE
jgi:hypothetical protein